MLALVVGWTTGDGGDNVEQNQRPHHRHRVEPNALPKHVLLETLRCVLEAECLDKPGRGRVIITS